MPHEAVDLVSRLLQYSPNLRCSAVSKLYYFKISWLYEGLNIFIFMCYFLCWITPSPHLPFFCSIPCFISHTIYVYFWNLHVLGNLVNLVCISWLSAGGMCSPFLWWFEKPQCMFAQWTSTTSFVRFYSSRYVNFQSFLFAKNFLFLISCKTPAELAGASAELRERLIPEHARKEDCWTWRDQICRQFNSIFGYSKP